MYTGEQYNESTGLYYLRARYMNPETGTFISMDTYAGSLDNPVSLHKYLYANANPVKYTDPSGNFSFSELLTSQTIKSIQESNIVQVLNIKKMMSWANLVITLHDIAHQFRLLMSGEATLFGLAFAMIKGMLVQAFINCFLTKFLGTAANMVLKVVGVIGNAGSFVEAVKSGDPKEIIIESLRLVVSIFTLKCQCFAGDTLVLTEDGEKPIEDIEVGDEVWAYDTETGEDELKHVTAVKISETDELVHVITSDGEDIRTTRLHPFYVVNDSNDLDSETIGTWISASELSAGDILKTQDSRIVTVKEVRIEKLADNIKVYNLEIEGLHTYYVDDGVLVHNDGCKGTRNTNGESGNSTSPDYYVTPAGDVIPSNTDEFNYNISMMQEIEGKYVSETSHGPVRIRIEGPHPMDENFNGDFESDHFVVHFHVEHRKNGLSGQWGKGFKNKISLPMSWIKGDD